ncbi:hypothetical protein V493_04374 [Pseudogymnoascus sp. VKM F-4281 (FW-2241)]|nr:hypothetical protein V493_04374 [Pseudogymnoascus sp. VKM F-4281 (FW-2241)]
MTRKRTPKPANPPPVVSTPSHDTHNETLATFLGTGGLRGYTTPPATFPNIRFQSLTENFDGLPTLLVLVGSLLNCDEDLLCDSEGRREYPRKRIGIDSREQRDFQVLKDLEESIGALTGQISNDEQRKLHAKLQSITEQMKISSLNTKVLLNHPDGSPNGDAFKQEAAVQKILQDISELETNVKLLANVNTINKSKELANDAQNPVKEAEELARRSRNDENLMQAERKQSGINNRTRSFNFNEAVANNWLGAQTYYKAEEDTEDAIREIDPFKNPLCPEPWARDTSPDAISVPKHDVKTNLEVKTEGEQSAIMVDLGTVEDMNNMAADTASLSTAKTVMCADDEQLLDTNVHWHNHYSNDRRAGGYQQKYWMEFPESARDDTRESHMDWARKSTPHSSAPAAWISNAPKETFPELIERLCQTQEPVAKADKDTTLDSEEYTIGWANKKRALTEKVAAKKAMNVALERRAIQRQEAEKQAKLQGWPLKRRGDLLGDCELQLKNREEHLEKTGYQSLGSKLQQQEDEWLLKQRGERLHDRDKQQQENDRLLEKLEKQLRERDFRLTEREHDVKIREAKWEKHQKQRQEAEGLLQQRERQLQKREEQLQTREVHLAKREDHMLLREREVPTAAGVPSVTPQTTMFQEMQSDIKMHGDQLASLQQTMEEVMEVRAQKLNLGKRIRALEGREMNASFAEEWVDALRKILEKRREGDEVNLDFGASGSPITKANWLAVLGVVDLVMRNDKIAWLESHKRFDNFRQALDCIENDGDEPSSADDGANGLQDEKPAAVAEKSGEVSFGKADTAAATKKGQDWFASIRPSTSRASISVALASRLPPYPVILPRTKIPYPGGGWRLKEAENLPLPLRSKNATEN